MWCTNILIVFTTCLVVNVAGNDLAHINEQLHTLTEQMHKMKVTHENDIRRLKKEIEHLRRNIPTDNSERNEQATLEWATTSMDELRLEMRELRENVNNSDLFRQLTEIKNELTQALTEASELAQLSRTHEARVDKLDSDVGRAKYDVQQMRAMVAELRKHFGKLTKESNMQQIEEMNEVIEPHVVTNIPTTPEHPHKVRHNKMVHTQISRLARIQDQLDEYQQTLQNQIMDVQRRLDRFEEPNWNLLSAKVEFLQLDADSIRNELKNVTRKVSDLDKVHASMLELREDMESVESVADKTIPEFRKEISKLDVNLAQLTAQSSYLKEDQENLRQSVKAIAVSVSNSIDRAEMDRLAFKKFNDTLIDLDSRTRQHYHRLNDHILKSEASPEVVNNTVIIPLPELIVEVKELQPVQREYEDLVNQLPKDCSSVSGPPGTYLIHPGNGPIDVWCKNHSTLLQRRYNGSVEFNVNYSEYVHGFGDPAGETWIGLEAMHLLTADNCSSMRIDMTDIYGAYWYAEYEHFSVGSASSGYVLNVAGFSGNASDAFEYQNHMEFSAMDRDRDISNTNCAVNYEGGWWFSHCQHVNINGRYTLGLTWFDSGRNEWIAVATSEMRMYRRPGCM